MKKVPILSHAGGESRPAPGTKKFRSPKATVQAGGMIGRKSFEGERWSRGIRSNRKTIKRVFVVHDMIEAGSEFLN